MQIINDWLKTYLIGPMEDVAAGDGGRGWRSELREKLSHRYTYNKNGIFVFDPTLEEVSKVGMEAATLHKKIKGWLASGNNHKIKEYGSLIWEGKTYIETSEIEGQAKLVHIMGDVDYVKNSDFLIARMEKNDRPCVGENTKILMADWTQKNIQDVKTGEEILGFKKIKGKTILVKTKVYNSQKTGYKKCIKTEDDKGNTIYTTEDHKFLTKNKKHGSIYNNICAIDNIFSIKQKFITETFLKGWLIGYLQNDGCFFESWRQHKIIIVSDKLEEINTVQSIYKKFGFTPTLREKIDKENHNKHYILTINKKKDYFELNDWKNNHPPSFDFKRGWITGAIDADGYYDKWMIKYTQSKINKLNRDIFKKYCKDIGIKFTIQFRQRLAKIFNRKINNSGEYVFNISKSYAFYIPSQFEYKRKNYNLSIDRLNSKIKKSNSHKRNIYDLSTGTGNYIANGFIIHNCGTFFEVGIALEHKIPIYVIQTMAKKEYPGSFVQAIFTSRGNFFDSTNSLLEFLDKKYKLKSRKCVE